MPRSSSQSSALKELVSIIGELPAVAQRSLLHQLKMRRALALAKQIDATEKPRFEISDSEIVDMVHEFRHGAE